jgi:hypothetical protein
MNYENSQIYCIRNKIDNLIYIGSTCQPLYKRFHQHKIASKNKSFKLYQHFKDIGIDNFYIELIESFPCENKNELRAREQYYCRDYNTFTNGLNKNCAIMDYDIKEYHREYNKDYYINNVDKFKEYNQKYYEKNIDKCKEYRNINYEKLNEKIQCDICNCKVTKYHLIRHYKTKKHQNNANTTTID